MSRHRIEKIAAVLLMCLLLTGCGSQAVSNSVDSQNIAQTETTDTGDSQDNRTDSGNTVDASSQNENSESMDLDLTGLSGTALYAQVTNMANDPQSYLGQSVRMQGLYFPSYFDNTQTWHHYVIVADGPGCCRQGLEFVWDGDHSYPDDYPAEQATIEIEGVYTSRTEDGADYYYIDTSSVTTIEAPEQN